MPTVWTVLGAIGLTGALTAWLSGYFASFLPPLPRLFRAIHNTTSGWFARGAEISNNRYRLVLCALEGDDAREGTLWLLRKALNPSDYPALQVLVSARCISLTSWYDRQDVTAGAAQAERILRAHRADAVLWGEVPKQGDSLRFFLRGANRQEAQVITFEKGLVKDRPDRALGSVLTAVALSQIAPVSDEGGRYLVTRLRPVVARLRVLLDNTSLVSDANRGNLYQALGLALQVLGEQSGDNNELECAVATYRSALQLRSRDEAPLDWAATQDSLGTALRRLGERERSTERLQEAVAAFHNALLARTRDRVPLDWAATLNGLGLALWRLGERDGGRAQLEEAVVTLRLALSERTRDRVPLDWAATQNGLGLVLWRLGESEIGTSRLEEAVAAFRAALAERTRNLVPLDWAATQNNLGLVLWRLGERLLSVSKLTDSIEAFEAALTEYRRDRLPLDWAMSQNNLGVVLQALGEQEGDTSRMDEAIAAFRSALEERTREKVPLRWAVTKMNLGEALTLRGGRGAGSERLREAVSHIRGALEEITQESVPTDWAIAQNKLGNALSALGKREPGVTTLAEAVAAWDKCLSVATLSWLPELISDLRSRRDEIQAELGRVTTEVPASPSGLGEDVLDT